MTGKKILVIGGLADSLVHFRWDLLESLVNQGNTVVTAAAKDDPHNGMTGQDVVGRLRQLGIEHHPVPIQRTGINPLGDLGTLRALVRICRQEKPDIVFAYSAKPIIYGMLAAWLCRVPRRVAMLTGLAFGLADNGQSRTFTQGLARRLFGITFRLCHALVFHNSDDLATLRLGGLLPGQLPVHVVNGSGVDIDHYQPVPLPEGPVTFLLIARLIREKGVAEYLASARLARMRHPEARFLLVGPLDPRAGELREPELRAWEQEGMGQWLGSMADVRIPLGRSHVFVLPSYHEGMPRTVLEAMAMGRAIITTDAPGCRQTVQAGENGYLVPVQDPEALALAMVRCLDDPQGLPAMGAASRRIAVEQYDVRRVSRATAQVILG
jgi:glycosyltransferase involved in cell wall biosynthesis